MKKTIEILFLILCFSNYNTLRATNIDCIVSHGDIHDGYIVKKIHLETYALPVVSFEVLKYSLNKNNDKISVSSNKKMIVVLGMERKKPFVIIKIPAYSIDSSGQIRQIENFTLTINEKTAAKTMSYKVTSDVTTSELATGKWYKIGITKTGFYKIDASFLTNLGVANSEPISTKNIRIFGNGGNMLPESNEFPRAVDLVENAICAFDGGDGMFNSGDYVIFYGIGPTTWNFDTTINRFTHKKNIYSDTSYYFITIDKGEGLRINEQSALPVGNISVTEFDYYDVHDEDLVNPGGIGKIWYGEQFNGVSGNQNQVFNFNVGTIVSNLYCNISFGITGDAGSIMETSVNGVSVGSIQFSAGTSDNIVMQLKNLNGTLPTSASSIGVNIAFSPAGSNSVGYLNYIEINARRPLVINSDQMNFRDHMSISSINTPTYILRGANASTMVWDVSNPQIPKLLKGTLTGDTYTFAIPANVLHEFAVINGSNLLIPSFGGVVSNQNLHGSPQVDNIIVTYPEFMQQAIQLADYHRARDKMRVIVVTPQQVYNEFSSGSQDISAIRDFVRMFYKRAGADSTQMPKYLTLFGGASYDYKNRLPNNSNFVPVFESKESSYNLSSFSTDDFYGFLDDNEDIESYSVFNALDIGIGRLPARTIDDATALVEKIVNYKKPATLGPWRISSTIIADNNDGAGNFMEDSEEMASHMTSSTRNLYNHNKIYLDAIPTISTPAGSRSPNANAAINERVFKGTMVINYIGHGNTQVWTEERILTQDDFSKWSNSNMLPFMITATCDFGQFDHPQYVSAGERLVIQKKGGVISILTTTAPVYNNYNNPLNENFLKSQLTQRTNGLWNSFGDACRIGKNEAYLISNNPSELANYRKFALLGDPALTANFPEHFINIDSIIDVATSSLSDSIKALGAYRITGKVHDANGLTLAGFNGILSVSLFDKPRTISTITTVNKTFQQQDNLVFKGKISVVNGLFSFAFIAPKDINYYYGTSKMSTYAHNGVTDGAGMDTSATVGGYSDNPVLNDVPPIVRPYINDSLFQNGGITGSNTSLFVSLISETGINVTGNKLGHDLIAILDGNKEQPFILNDYYETALNTYQRGYVNFPIAGLSNGRHSLRVKAWDVNNNSGEGTVDFIVLDDKIMAIENLTNFPNPFNDKTHFVFEHNHPGEKIKVKLVIFNSVGSLVYETATDFLPMGSRSSEIIWDGSDGQGNKLPSGVYTYKISMTSDLGYTSSACQKVVIVR